MLTHHSTPILLVSTKTHSVNNNPQNPSGLNENPTKPKKADSDNDNGIDSDIVNDKDKKKKYNSLTLKHYDDVELNDLFIDFLRLRKSLKAQNTERAINTLKNKIKHLTKENKMECINESIMNSWKGLFPKDTKQSKPNRQDIKDIDDGYRTHVDDKWLTEGPF